MAKKKVVAPTVEEAVVYPEVGTYTDKKELQKFYKGLTDAQLAEWVELEGLEYTPNDSQPINRMRMAMAILYLHFPKAPAKKKKESKYAKYSLEDLVKLALENDVVFEETSDERIMRMRAIMALRASEVIE